MSKQKSPSKSDDAHGILEWFPDLKNIVQTTFEGTCSRYDGKIRVGSQVRECSIYKMSDNLVRIDIKKQLNRKEQSL